MQHGLRSSTKRLAPKITPSCLPLSLYAIHLPYRRTSYSSARIVSAFSGTTATDTVAAECIMPPLLQAPASSTTLTKPEPSACVEPPDTRATASTICWPRASPRWVSPEGEGREKACVAYCKPGAKRGRERKRRCQ